MAARSRSARRVDVLEHGVARGAEHELVHKIVVAVLPGEGEQGVPHPVQPVERVPDGGGGGYGGDRRGGGGGGGYGDRRGGGGGGGYGRGY